MCWFSQILKKNHIPLNMGLLFIQFSDTAIVGLVCLCAKIIHNALGGDKNSASRSGEMRWLSR